MSRRPSFQFYPADWRKDPALSACSLAARGLWIELVCIAHEADVYGHLTINGKPMSTAQLARMVGETPTTIAKLLAELESAGVFSRTEDGCIYSRRMVNDERIRNVRAEAGRLGGNPNLLNQNPKQIDDVLLNQKDKQASNQTDKQSLTPSSSSSTSVFKEPIGSLSGSGDPPGMPDCPHSKILDLFAARLPELPQPRRSLWAGSASADALRSRWRWLMASGELTEKTEAAALHWFDEFFAYVSTRGHLMGESDGGWKADMGWLMKAANFTKVVQGNYRERKTLEAAA